MKINEFTEGKNPLFKINKFLDDKKRKEEYARKLQQQRDEKDSVKEDLGSIPPLPELILMAIAAQTAVGALKLAFKTAVKTGKGLKKLNQIRKLALGAGKRVADYAMPEATSSEVASRIVSDQKSKFYQAALDALHHLVTTDSKQSVAGHAFDIARVFNGINAKELEKMYVNK
jgi:hypothetical protein